MQKRTKIIKGIILFIAVVFLILFLRNVDFDQVFIQLQRVGWRFVLLLFISGIGYFLSAWAWYYCFEKLDLKYALPRLFVYRMIGETLALLNPTSVIAGDLSKVYFLQQVGVPGGEASSATLVARMLQVISLLCLIVLTAIFLLDVSFFLDSQVVKFGILTVLVLLTVGILVFVVSPQMYLYRIVSWFTTQVLGKDNTKVDSVKRINQAMVDFYIHHKWRFGIAFILTFLHWFTGAVEFYVILGWLDLPISMVDALVVEVGVMLFKVVGGFVPGQLGVEEQGNRLMLQTIGVSMAGLWVVVSILRRARQFFWICVGIVLYLVFYKKEEK